MDHAAVRPDSRRAFGAPARSIKVSTFGGYFEQMFAAHVYPAFTKATGIAVQSIEQPSGAQFLLQLAAANQAGKPPMDVGCIIEVDVLRGRALKLWRTLDGSRMPNLSRLLPNLTPAQPCFLAERRRYFFTRFSATGSKATASAINPKVKHSRRK